MKLTRLPFFCVIPLAFGWITFASADNILLGSHGQLQGKIEPSSKEGMIQLRSPLSAEPLLIKTDKISSLKFSNEKQATKLPQIVRLKNGDQLPVEIDSFSNNVLRFISPWSSSHDLDKSVIDSLVIGSSDNNILYSGPNPKEWIFHDGCEFTDNAIRFTGSGNASWKVPKLPSRHTISCNLEIKSDTNIKIIIATDSNQPYNAEVSGYTLAISQENLQLTRNAKAGKPKIYLLNDQTFLSQEKNTDSLSIELRVDRDNRMLQLLINGKSVRNSIVDPQQTGEMPKGVNYHVMCNSRQKDTYLRNFSISDWNSNGTPSVVEKRLSTKTDMLYDIESNHCSGELVAISKEPGKTITFSNPHSPAPIELPLQSAAIFYFSGELTKPQGPFMIRTSGSGTLHVTEYQLSNGMVISKHPIMGNLAIPINYIEEISRS